MLHTHACCKRMFHVFRCFIRTMQVFQLFWMYVASISSRCCKSRPGCCIYMHVARVCFTRFRCFHTYIASVSSGCCICFAMATRVFSSVSDVRYKYFSCFGRMLQVFHLDVAKVDLMLLMLQCDPPAVVHAHGKRRDGTRHGGERGKGRGIDGGRGMGGPRLCMQQA